MDTAVNIVINSNVIPVLQKINATRYLVPGTINTACCSGPILLLLCYGTKKSGRDETSSKSPGGVKKNSNTKRKLPYVHKYKDHLDINMRTQTVLTFPDI